MAYRIIFDPDPNPKGQQAQEFGPFEGIFPASDFLSNRGWEYVGQGFYYWKPLNEKFKGYRAQICETSRVTLQAPLLSPTLFPSTT